MAWVRRVLMTFFFSGFMVAASRVVVVRLVWCSVRALQAMAKVVWGSAPPRPWLAALGAAGPPGGVGGGVVKSSIPSYKQQ
jgi:hypothetical protein